MKVLLVSLYMLSVSWNEWGCSSVCVSVGAGVEMCELSIRVGGWVQEYADEWVGIGKSSV